MRRRTLHFVAVMRLVLALVIPGGVATVYADAPGYELCIEHSPVKAGTVTPNTGTHRFSANSVVTVSADAEQGYEFAYWIGDVSDPKAKSTTVHVNASKIVVAVFKPAYDEEIENQISIGGGGGRGGPLAPTRVDFGIPGFSITGGGGGGGFKKVPTPVSVPVVVTPEPTTILLLGLGALAIRRRRRQGVT